MVIEAERKRITVMDPRAEAVEAHAVMAPRPDTLKDKTVGLLDNSKHNADNLLHLVADLLKEKFELRGVQFARKPDASRPAPVEILDQLAKESDFAVVAVGD